MVELYDFPEGDIGLDDLIEIIVTRVLERRWGPMPARVTAYDQSRHTVDAQPSVKARYSDGSELLPPMVRAAPVFVLGGALGSLVAPPQVGDYVLLIPCGIDISVWSRQGSAAEGSLAPSLRAASLSDCIALHGLRPAGQLASTAKAADGPVLACSTGYLGSSAATDFVALASKVLSEMQAHVTWDALHTHPVSGASTLAPSTTPPTPGSVASAKIRSE